MGFFYFINIFIHIRGDYKTIKEIVEISQNFLLEEKVFIVGPDYM